MDKDFVTKGIEHLSKGLESLAWWAFAGFLLAIVGLVTLVGFIVYIIF